ncbi:MAG: transcriptional repressor NrdR [Clostridiales bacterium]|nr:transcriptional repressor NrdR [Clostridiales bacterium]
MRCPACHNIDTKVVDSRMIADGLAIRRRRECIACGCRFSTVEELKILNLTVIKRTGQKEAYLSDKIYDGLRKSFKKRPFSDEDIKKLLFNIERKIQVVAKKEEILASKIGEIVMNGLKDIDKVAYIRFASVCQGFENVDEFDKAIKKVL